MAKKHGNILVVDDNEGILKSLNFSLKFEFTEVITIKSPNQIPSILRQQSIDVILLDMNFSAGINSGNEGIFWLREIMKLDPDIVVILITAYGDVELAVKGIKEGATDFILKPWNDEKLLATLHNALRLKQQKTKIKKLVDKEKVYQSAYDKAFSTIIGESDEMKKVIDTISKVSGTEANVLILGENGTGKELIAREVHRRSLRRKNTFLSVDIASLSETLMESELFGHVKGAFTSAHEDRKGRFELASGGTLFLDEIGNLTMRAQTKLLSALQSRKIIPLGSNRETAIDIRLLSATNRPIYDMVSANTFREDLLFRLNTIEIHVPPLRKRGEDIILLAEFFLEKYAKKYQRSFDGITAEAKRLLLNYNWPGNIRELQHAMEKAIILCEGNVCDAESFSFANAEDDVTDEPEIYNLEEMEKRTIARALKKHNRNLSTTARELGITRKTLYSKIDKYDL